MTTAVVKSQEKKELKGIKNKFILLVYYSSPIVVMSVQGLGLFISMSDIQYRFFDYLENTGEKESYVQNNIENICNTVQKYGTLEVDSGSKIFNAFIYNTLIIGIFTILFLFSFVLHLLVRLVIKQIYITENARKINYKLPLYALLAFLFVLNVINTAFVAVLASIETLSRIKWGMIACIAVTFLLLIFLIVISPLI